MSSRVDSPLKSWIEPVSTEEFFTSIWGKTHFHFKGSTGRFAHLLPWDQLNLILRQHRLDTPRLRLVQGGKPVPETSWLKHASNKKRKTPIPRLQTVGLLKELREGATLVLDAVDELYEPLQKLASDLELEFHEHIQINTYAGWHSSHGFDLHWDDHDVFILQVAGSKRWAVYGMTRPYPVPGDRRKPQKPSTENPIFDAVLNDGDVLYIPRGWWHVATPLNEPTLHLTVGVHNRRGLDMVRWLAERVVDKEIFRRDLPRFATHEARTQHEAELRHAFADLWGNDLMDRYFQALDAKASARVKVDLAVGPTDVIIPNSNRAVVTLLAPRKLRLVVSDGMIEFSSLGKRWTFSETALPVLQLLDERRSCTIAELLEFCKPATGKDTLYSFLKELVTSGLVAVAAE